MHKPLDSWRLVKAHNLTDEYATTGNRTYLVGTQDGRFPDMGHHVPGEMGGLWNHPIKLLDGFWAKLDGAWLERATEFVSAPHYNEIIYRLPGLTVTRHQFVPDDQEALVVTYRFANAGPARTAEFTFLARTDLLPVWMAEQAGVKDAPDSIAYDAELKAFVGRDEQNPWFVVFGAGLAPASQESGVAGPEQTRGQGATGALTYQLDLPAGGTAELTFVVAGSYKSREEAVATFQRVLAEGEGLFAAKAARYQSLADLSRAEIPDPVLQETYEWVKFNYDSLVREVPEQGKALGAGLPTYPWWFGCDNSYALFGLLPLGQWDVVKETLRLVARLSNEANNGSGRIMHEANTLGVVPNQGNTQETPHFVKAVYHTWRWTGDDGFLRELYETCRKGVLEWLLTEKDPDGDLMPSGYGLIEIEHLNLEVIDTAVYTYEALAALAEMAPAMGDAATGARCAELAERCKAEIHRRFWLEEEGLYADMLGTPEELGWRLEVFAQRAAEQGMRHALPYLRELQAQVKAAPAGQEIPILHKNWMINVPMEAGIAPRECAIRALDRMASHEFTWRDGLMLSGLHHTHAMTISTGVQAVAEASYGRMDEAVKFMRLIARGLHMRTPGSPSEMSPDYGCLVQAWTGYGIVWPLTQFLGLVPNAPQKSISLAPQLPAQWPSLKIENLRIGDTAFDIKVENGTLTVSGGTPEWTVVAGGQSHRAGTTITTRIA